jgi:Cu2+-containing amine oxidase
MNDALVRHGQEVVYFAVLDAANYNYILEWAFRDDGTIASRTGSTGPKFFGTNDTTGHTHDFTWRLDIDLNGSAGDSACLFTHIENLAVTPSTATDSCSPITVEAGLDWRPMQFNTLKIKDSTLTNGLGHQTNYELVPLRTGTSRHSEAFTQHDGHPFRFRRNPGEWPARLR